MYTERSYCTIVYGILNSRRIVLFFFFFLLRINIKIERFYQKMLKNKILQKSVCEIRRQPYLNVNRFAFFKVSSDSNQSHVET